MPRLDRERTERLLRSRARRPSLINVPSGCPFHPRCAYADRTGGLSQTERPPFAEGLQRHYVRLPPRPGGRAIWENEIRPTL